jgi:steroid delta-isomerase-like uncharacterized protein
MKHILIILPLILCVITSCQNKATNAELEKLKAKSELEEFNKSVIQRYWDGKWNERRIETLDELQTPDVVYHGTSETLNGIEEYKEAYKEYSSALHDTKIVVEELIAEGDQVMSRVRMTAIHANELGGIPASGKKITAIGFTVFRLVDGKIAEEWEILDQLGMMMQMGMELKMKEDSN